MTIQESASNGFGRIGRLVFAGMRFEIEGIERGRHQLI